MCSMRSMESRAAPSIRTSPVVTGLQKKGSKPNDLRANLIEKKLMFLEKSKKMMKHL